MEYYKIEKITEKEFKEDTLIESIKFDNSQEANKTIMIIPRKNKNYVLISKDYDKKLSPDDIFKVDN